MAVAAGPRERPVIPWMNGVRQRAILCMLAALLGLFEWEWLPSISFDSSSHTITTGVTINGTGGALSCRGQGGATVIMVGAPLVSGVIDDAVQAKLKRSVRLCSLIVTSSDSRGLNVPFSNLLHALLIGGKVPGPYAIITHAAESTVRTWMIGGLVSQTAGFVLVDASLNGSSTVVLAANGDQWPLPMGDADTTALSILQLFWPPEEA